MNVVTYQEPTSSPPGGHMAGTGTGAGAGAILVISLFEAALV